MRPTKKRPKKKTWYNCLVEEGKDVKEEYDAKQENIEKNSKIEESEKRRELCLFQLSWGLFPTKKQTDSDKLILTMKSLKLYL